MLQESIGVGWKLVVGRRAWLLQFKHLFFKIHMKGRGGKVRKVRKKKIIGGVSLTNMIYMQENKPHDKEEIS